jgi:hypothetical protein
LILRKLGAYPRQNSLALALRELGRVERTLFTLEWLQNPELRRRVQVGLNKGEAKNALARAVFFNRLGELRDLTPLSSTAHSGDLVLPFSSFFLEFFSSKLNHRLVACCHQTWIRALSSSGTENSAKAFSFLNTRSDFLIVAAVAALLATPSAALGDSVSSVSVAALPTRGDDVLEDHGGSILCPRAGHSAPG